MPRRNATARQRPPRITPAKKIVDIQTDNSAGTVATGITQEASMRDYARNWERYAHWVALPNIQNTYQRLILLAGSTTNDYMHYKNLTFSLYCRTRGSDPKHDIFEYRWYKWNSELKANLADQDITDLEKDYSVNLRQRYWPSSTTADKVYESRFKGVLLQPEESFAVYAKRIQGNDEIEGVMMVTGWVREWDRGEF